ncbi:MAG: electron transfer flavoprotein subunit beta/FixA family protein [Acidobacteriota bacterium]|nr:electron transfer flavoprotein subunit beta/FixA family protein [Acidobacteriota bacterium]
MKIVVTVKQVPARDSQLRVNPQGTWIEDTDLNFEINEPDAYALEEALRLKEAHGGEVVVVSAGPERVSSTIREALAKGADRAIHILQEERSGADPLRAAEVLAQALEGENPDLILTGLQSEDFGYGQTGVILAELLGLPHATIIMQVEVAGSALKLKRELENGYFQHVETSLPALLTMQSGSNRLRYATLMGIKKAKTKEVRQFVPQNPASGANSFAIERVYLPERSKQSRIFDGPAKESAAKLVEKLKFEARVL